MDAVSSLVEFLLSLIRDPEMRAEFQQHPEQVLAEHGLDDLCLTDVTDAAPLLADREGVQASGSTMEPATGHAIHEITHITNNYDVDKSVHPESPDQSGSPDHSDSPDVYNIHNVDDRDQIINVDDRDNTYIQAAGDVNIDDSFNQDNDAANIDDSYNEDNDGLDNKGGVIDDSNAGGGGSINVGNDHGSVTEDSTDAPTEGSTEAPTEGSTEAPTENSTAETTEPPADEPQETGQGVSMESQGDSSQDTVTSAINGTEISHETRTAEDSSSEQSMPASDAEGADDAAEQMVS